VSLKLRDAHRIFVFEEYVDLRAGFDRLSMLVREKMAGQILSGDLFLFLGKNRKKLKAICFDGTGLLLISKRLDHGRFMLLNDLDQREITEEEFQLLIRGSVIRRNYFNEDALTKSHSHLNLNP
jgi:transposase